MATPLGNLFFIADMRVIWAIGLTGDAGFTGDACLVGDAGLTGEASLTGEAGMKASVSVSWLDE